MTVYALTLTARRHDGSEIISPFELAGLLAIWAAPMVDVVITADDDPVLVIHGARHVELGADAPVLLDAMLAKANDYDRLTERLYDERDRP